MASTLNSRLKRVEAAIEPEETIYILRYPTPPEIDADGNVVPNRCEGALYLGGAKSGRSVVYRQVLGSLYRGLQ